MVASWLRPLFKKNRSAKPLAKAPRPLSLMLETLEDRVVPDTKFWTGAVIAANGLGAGSANARWSIGSNWANGSPQNGDSVVFPPLGSGPKPPAQLGPPFVWEVNSLIDYSVSLLDFTIQDDNYHFDGPAPVLGGMTMPTVLTISGSISSSIPQTVGPVTGVSLIGPFQFGATSNVNIVLTNTAALNATNNGVLEIAAPISQLAGVTAGLNKNGAGTMTLSGNNTFSGTVSVTAGILNIASSNALGTTANGTVVQPGATLGVSFGTVPEGLTINGPGVGGIGALALVSRPLAQFAPTTFIPSGFATWAGNIALGSDSSIGSVGFLDIDGQITGGFNLTKVGGGTASFNNSNTYLGQTNINQGELQITNNNALANGNSFTRVASGARLSINGALTVSERLFLNGTGGNDLNGNPVGALRIISMGPTANIGGTGVGPGSGLITLESDTSIGGVNNGVLTLIGLDRLEGAFNLRKVGNATLVLPNRNQNFTGNTSIDNGTVIISNAQALGPATSAGGSTPGGSITVTSLFGPVGGGLTSGTLQVQGNYTLQKAITLNGPGFSNVGALRIADVSGVGSNILVDNGLTLGSATRIVIDPNSSLDVQGVLDAPVGTAATLNKGGNGTLFLSNSNTYLGATILESGLTVIRTNTSLGAAGGNGTTVANGATLRLANPLTISEDLVLTGVGVSITGVNQGALQAISGTNLVNGNVTLSNVGSDEADIRVNAGTLELFGSVGGGANLRKIGAGELRLTGDTQNTFVSSTFIDEGTLALRKSPGVDALRGPIFVGDGIGGNNVDILRLDAANQIPEQTSGVVPLTITVDSSGLFNLNGFDETIGGLILTGAEVMTAGVGGIGTLTLAGDVTANDSAEISSISGRLNLGTTPRTFNVLNGAGTVDLLISAAVSGPAAASFIKTGAGTLRLTNPANNYAGATTVNGGTLEVGASNVLPNTTALTITASGSVDLLGNTETVASLNGNGALALGAGAFTVTTSGNDGYSGSITGTAASTFTKQGAGTLTLSGNSTGYLGTTTITAGRLIVGTGGNLSNSTTNVQSGATLGGTGTAGAVNVNGTGRIDPGVVGGTGTLSTGNNVVFASTSTYAVQLNGTAAGQFDRLAVTGDANLNNATLALSTGFTPNVGASFDIVTATNAVNGTFRDQNGNTLNNGATFTINGRVYQITYANSGTGGSVTLTVTGRAANGTLTSSVNPASPGQSVTFTATFTPAVAGDPTPVTGTVTFRDTTNNVVLGMDTLTAGDNGVASTTTTFVTTGTRNVVAELVGDAPNMFQTTTAPVSQRVNIATATTVTNSTSGPVMNGTPVTLTATVTNATGTGGVPNGSVTFTNANTGAFLGIAGVNAAGQASLTTTAISAGSNTIVATFNNAAGNFRSSSGSTTVVVNRQTLYAAGAAAGSNGIVYVYDGQTGAFRGVVQPFGGARTGVKVAVGDVNNDGVSDLVTAGGLGQIVIYNGRDLSMMASYSPFQDFGYTGPINIGVGDVDGNGTADVAVAPERLSGFVRVFSGGSPVIIQQIVDSFFGFSTGVSLAVADVDNNGRGDIVAGTATQFGYVAVFQGLTSERIQQYFPFPSYTGGVSVAAGDVNGDNFADVIIGFSAAPFIMVNDGATQQQIGGLISAFPGQPTGVTVSTTDRDGNGRAEIIAGLAPVAPNARNKPFILPAVRIFDPLTGNILADFLAFQQGLPFSSTGVYVGGSYGQ